MRTLFRALVWVVVVCGADFTATAQTSGRAIVSGFDTFKDGRNDDGTYTAPSGCSNNETGGTCPGTKMALGFTVNFFGLSFSQLYVNTNGNVTFDSPLPAHTPFNLTSTNRQIIAPFFADVDTRNPSSGTVSLGPGTFGGRNAFGVNWIDVGYYLEHVDRKNRFQLILVDRSDTGAGNFDIVFNYDTIQWETGDAMSSGGSNGLGGHSARAGYSNGTGLPGTALELRGSAVNGAFLDFNNITGLIHGSLNSDVPGRYIFFARNGQISGEPLSIAGSCPVSPGVRGIAYPRFSVTVSGGTPPYTFTSVLPPGFTFDPDTLTVRGTPTASGDFPISIQVTDSTPGVLQQTRTYTCSVSIAAVAAPLRITGPCAGGVQNRPYWIQLGISGGTGGYAVTYNGPYWLVPGASAPSPGVFTYSLTGTPPSAGTFPISVTVKDSAGTIGVYSCAITITPAIKITSGCPASLIPQGSAVNYDFSAIGGTATPTWKVVSGRLPDGLSLTSAGRIFGTALGPPGPFAFTVAAFSGDISDQKSCFMLVGAPALRVTSGCPADGVTGVPYGPFPLGATGGLGSFSYKFAITGNLPDGLSLADNNILGTPQKPGIYTFSVQVTSGDQTATSSACSLRIAPGPLAIAGLCPATPLRVGSILTLPFGVTGGQAPFTWTYDNGIPDLTLAYPTGSINSLNGTLNREGSFTFSLNLSDSAGVQARPFTCALTVNPPAIPAITLVAGAAPSDLLQPVPLTLQLSSPTAVALTGNLVLEFTSSASFPANNPEVTFRNGATIPFLIAVGSTSVQVTTLQRGTVAGLIHLHVTDLATVDGKTLSSASPSLDIVVPNIPPVFTVALQDTDAGVDVVLKGYSTTRDITGGSILVNVKQGSSLNASTVDLSTVNVAQRFADYYGNNTPTGSFDEFRIPLILDGDKAGIESVTVTLINSAGSAQVTQAR